MKIVVLDGYCLNPGDLDWDALAQLGELTVYERTPEAEVVERARGAAGLFTNKCPLREATLAQLPELRYIGVLATGYNIVDVAAARARGITVTNVPTYGTASVAQFAIALLLELCHRVGTHAELTRAGAWEQSPDWSFTRSPQVELMGKTMGVVGFGRIGKATARIAEALGMTVLAHDVQPGMTPLEELLERSDVVSLHCPLTAENKGLINAARLRRMKPSAFLINTSRGPLVVDDDLAAALDEGVIAGAGIDVLSVEPPLAGNPLLAAKNCIVTPHMAWTTKEARARLMEIVAANYAAFLAGRAENAVMG
ncbi:MAG: D-2-hydroxyacid dehydrogenase [Bryobacter sp.]|nr:D-2-hydroxyacid dehydrogenase [Bryobacter sp.]